MQDDDLYASSRLTATGLQAEDHAAVPLNSLRHPCALALALFAPPRALCAFSFLSWEKQLEFSTVEACEVALINALINLHRPLRDSSLICRADPTLPRGA